MNSLELNSLIVALASAAIAAGGAVQVVGRGGAVLPSGRNTLTQPPRGTLTATKRPVAAASLEQALAA